MPDDDREYRATLVTKTSRPSIVPSKVDLGSACLVVIYGVELGKRIPLGGAAIECGRAVQADVPLDDDAVSRRHAQIAWSGTAHVLRDLGSTNGTYVNDRQVKEKLLADGDQIKIGRTIFKFLSGNNVELAYHDEIYRLMTFDGLTQVHNKRSFEATLDREVARSKRHQRLLSLVLFDLDHFKRVNDERGHLAGDAVLRQIASLVRSVIRKEDVLARVGGEEFGVVCPEVNLDGARVVASKIRGVVEATPCRFEEQAIPITTSLGVASLVECAEPTPAELYARADERLYRAKKNGRNRVE